MSNLVLEVKFTVDISPDLVTKSFETAELDAKNRLECAIQELIDEGMVTGGLASELLKVEVTTYEEVAVSTSTLYEV